MRINTNKGILCGKSRQIFVCVYEFFYEYVGGMVFCGGEHCGEHYENRLICCLRQHLTMALALSTKHVLVKTLGFELNAWTVFFSSSKLEIEMKI